MPAPVRSSRKFGQPVAWATANIVNNVGNLTSFTSEQVGRNRNIAHPIGLGCNLSAFVAVVHSPITPITQRVDMLSPLNFFNISFAIMVKYCYIRNIFNEILMVS